MDALTPREQSVLEEIEAVDLLIADLNGILRAKRVRASALPGLMRAGGLRVPGSMFSMDSTGSIVHGTGIVAAEGERDRFCTLLPGTLQPVPWSSGPRRAQAIVRMLDEDGEPFFADPFAALERVEARLAADGYTPSVAAELEFYLFEPGDPETADPAPSALRGATQVYAASRLEERSAFVEAVHRTCAEQQIATGTTVAESGQGHFEINLQHRPGAMAAIVDAIAFKRVVREVAREHGFTASFMAKPTTNASSSGLHFHVSLAGRDGSPAFVSTPEVNTTLRHAVSGLCETMAEAMFLFAPNANSYRRYQPGAFIPMATGWGRNNRTTALRIPPGAARIEHRVAGADANPCLVLAAILAGIHHGITTGREPPPEQRGDATGTGTPLPVTWSGALQAAEAATILPGYLGERFWRLFLAVKHEERARFVRHVTPLERRLFLGTF